MIHTFHIDDSDPKAKAFLEFVKTLDFVEEETFSAEQILAIENGLDSLEKKGGIPHEEVMSEMKRKYPDFFRK